MANPRLNERDRRGTKIRTLNANVTVVGRLIPQKKGAIYYLDIIVVGVRILDGQSATQPAGYAYRRVAAFITSATGAVTQLGTPDTIGTDKETDSDASIQVVTDGTNVDVMVSASYPTDWSCYVTDVTNDQVLVG